MKDIRKGNDINVRWGIYAEGAPFSLEGKEISLYLRTPYGKKEVTPVVEGNAVLWTFFGKEQKHSGKYSLELVVNEDAEGMVTTDACDFVNLVSCSCKVGGADEQGVQTESIELTSSFEFVPYDDTELRKMIEGKQDTLESGKTIKTINGQSILGEGNLEIEGGGESYDDTEIRAELDELSTEIEQVSENKQDKISDLDSIRSGASKGKTSEQTSNKTTTISESSTDTQYPSAKAVYDATQKMMPATPSGDPMHYMYEAEGATYNATDEDIPMVGIYGDSYVHKAKHWHLNELGDITNEEMRAIYSERYPLKANNILNNVYKTSTQRTFICNAAVSDSGHTENYFMANAKNLKTVFYKGSVTYVLLTSLTNWAYDSSSLQKILTQISLQYATSSSALTNAFGKCQSLEYVQLYKLSQSISFKDSPLLSKSSILYMIQKEAATAAITITLHADAYDRAMADADIQAALTAHPNVSLAKA